MRFLRPFHGSILPCQTRFLQLLFLVLSPVLVTGAAGRSIEETDAWRVAIFFVLFFVLSFMLEQFFHNVEHYLHEVNETGILEAVHKIKEELMLLGFISLLLIIFEEDIVRICLPYPYTRKKPNDILGIPCCNTVPSQILQDEILRTLQECTNQFINNSLIAKEHMVDVSACNDDAVYKWRKGEHDTNYGYSTPGYVPLPTSPLLAVCPAPGQDRNTKLISDKHDFECPLSADGEPTAPFMDLNALHQLHTLIFLTAMAHILYSTLIMVISQYRVNDWTRWETYGDDDDETVDKLRTPPKYPHFITTLVMNCFHQCIKTVDPMTYIAVRRYYIVRNNLPKDFNFNEQLMEVHRKDFGELVGVSSWMWLIVIILVLTDGYIPSETRSLKMLNTYVAVCACLVAGTKLMFVFRNVVHGVLHKLGFDHTGGKGVSEEELRALQDDPIYDPHIFDDVDAHFWCTTWCCCKKRRCLGDKAPKVMLNLIRLVMFQNAFTLAQLTFYGAFVTNVQFEDTCFFKARAPLIFFIQCVFVVLMFLMNGLVTVPLYSICAITTHHRSLKGRLHKEFHTVHHTLKDELKIIEETLHDHSDHGKPHSSSSNHGGGDHHSNDHGNSAPDIHVSSLDSASTPGKTPLLKKTSGIPNAFMFHAKQRMLEARLAKTQRELEAMRTLKAHLSKPETPPDEGDGSRTKVAPAPAPADGDCPHNHLMTAESVSKISMAVTAISKFPVVRMTLYGIGLLFVVVFVLITPKMWWGDYGYYVPHWTYEGWGGPKYWSTLTNNEDSHMDKYNSKHKEEWVVGPGDEDKVHQDWPNKGRCKRDKECVSYRACARGKLQSPININLMSWKRDMGGKLFEQNQYQYAIDDPNMNVTSQKLGDLFTADPSTTFKPKLYHGQLKFYCNLKKDIDCGGVFKWKGETYSVYYLTLHTPAEHTFDNIQNGMEMQIYMRNKNKNVIALSVLFDVGVEESRSIKEIDNLFGSAVPNINTGRHNYERLQQVLPPDNLQSEEDTTTEEPKEVNLGNLVHSASTFYHYMGSYTTPPCEEGHDGNGMDWLIQAHIVHMTEKQWQGIHDFIGYPGNARPTQDLERFPSRKVTYWGEDEPPSPKSITSLGIDW